MIHLLGFFKNPLFKLVADKTIGAVSHKLEKDKIIKVKEIEAAKTVSVEQIKQSKSIRLKMNSFSSFSRTIICHFIPALQPTAMEYRVGIYLLNKRLFLDYHFDYCRWFIWYELDQQN